MELRYVGSEDILTRGDAGVSVRGAHTLPEDPEGIYVFDPDFGDQLWGSLDAALASGDWEMVE